MIFFTETQKQQLLENGKSDNPDKDFPPVAKVSVPGTEAIWLLSELNPEYPHIAFGLCDLGMGFPEMGYVDLREILACSVLVLNDVKFTGKFPLTVYARAARAHDKIIYDEQIVCKYQNR